MTVNTLPVDGLGPANAAADWLIVDGLAPAEGTAVGVVPFEHEQGAVVRAGESGEPGGFVGTTAEPRPARADLTYVVRPWDKWMAEAFSGLHGTIVESRETAHDGPVLPWDIDLTTLRSAPVGGWDTGLAVGSPGVFVL